jgi:hypothetical protein
MTMSTVVCNVPLYRSMFCSLSLFVILYLPPSILPFPLILSHLFHLLSACSPALRVSPFLSILLPSSPFFSLLLPSSTFSPHLALRTFENLIRDDDVWKATCQHPIAVYSKAYAKLPKSVSSWFELYKTKGK